jgi:hypothetical protein
MQPNRTAPCLLYIFRVDSNMTTLLSTLEISEALKKALKASLQNYETKMNS